MFANQTEHLDKKWLTDHLFVISVLILSFECGHFSIFFSPAPSSFLYFESTLLQWTSSKVFEEAVDKLGPMTYSYTALLIKYPWPRRHRLSNVNGMESARHLAPSSKGLYLILSLVFDAHIMGDRAQCPAK